MASERGPGYSYIRGYSFIVVDIRRIEICSVCCVNRNILANEFSPANMRFASEALKMCSLINYLSVSHKVVDIYLVSDMESYQRSIMGSYTYQHSVHSLLISLERCLRSLMCCNAALGHVCEC